MSATLEIDRLEKELAGLGLPIVTVASEVPDHQTYLRRPDQGRRLNTDSLNRLKAIAPANETDLSIVIADGLSATAAQLHAAAVVAALLQMLNLTFAPITIVRFGRVAIMDPIGQALRARIGLILLGERPGLGAADSLGAYLVFNPMPGRTDADRNCVSNIRPSGLPPAEAAETIAYLIAQILRRQLSGVAVKDERKVSLTATARSELIG